MILIPLHGPPGMGVLHSLFWSNVCMMDAFSVAHLYLSLPHRANMEVRIPHLQCRSPWTQPTHLPSVVQVAGCSATLAITQVRPEPMGLL